MNWRKNRNHFTNYCSRWRNSNLGKTKPNHRYFIREINRVVHEHLDTHGEEMKKKIPEIYYSMKNRKLPKKYQKKSVKNLQPVNAFLPNNVEKKPKVINDKFSITQNPTKKKNLSKYIYWVNPYEPINKCRLGPSRIMNKKKYFYY
jgi:hypothetical protein